MVQNAVPELSVGRKAGIVFIVDAILFFSVTFTA
jgi:hypothetical protein